LVSFETATEIVTRESQRSAFIYVSTYVTTFSNFHHRTCVSRVDAQTTEEPTGALPHAPGTLRLNRC